MKTFKILLKPISYSLLFLILFQGCVVYKFKPSSLNDAVAANTRVKIKTIDNQTTKFRRVEFKNDQYVGIKETVKVQEEINPETGIVEKKRKMDILEEKPLEDDNIEKVYLQDKTLSVLVPLSIPVAIISTYIIAVATY